MHSPSFRMIVWITAGVVRDVAACLRPAADAAPVALPGPPLIVALECVVLPLPPERTLDRPAGTVSDARKPKEINESCASSHVDVGQHHAVVERSVLRHVHSSFRRWM